MKSPSRGSKTSNNNSARRLAAILAGTFAVTMIIGCDQTVSPTGVGSRRAVRPAPVLAPPIMDPVMGALSPVARHIVIALRDSATRVAIIDAMRLAEPRGLGLDLTACSNAGPVHDLFAKGEERGGARATDICAVIAGRLGATLYLNSAALSAWDPSVIPTVIAIDHPERKLPRAFLGYRSPTQTITLSDSAPLAGPVLLVLGTPHPLTVARQPFKPLRTVARVVHVDSTTRISH